MGFIKKFLAKLVGFFSKENAEDPQSSFPVIDPEKIKAQLDIVRQARAHGAAGIPGVRDTQATEVEYQIQGTVGKMRAATVKYGDQWLKQIQQRLDAVDLTRDTNNTVQLGDEFVRKADSILSIADARLREEVREAKAKKEILDAFRAKNRLPQTPAKMPSTSDHVRKVAYLVIFGAVESMINSLFFASGMAGGIVEGALVAAVLAAVNILGCFFAGKFFSNKNHVQGGRRMCGYSSGLVGALWTLAVGLFVAYCRYVLPLVNDESSDQLGLIGESIWSLTSPFTSFESIGLFLVTVAFGISSLYHGYSWSDPYPGYSKVYGSYAQSYRRMIQFVDSLRKELESAKGSTLLKIDANVKQAEDALKRFKRNMGEKSVAKKKVSEHLVLADDTIRALTQCYRYENQMVRPANMPRPDYFDQPVALHDQEFPDFGVERDEARLSEQEKLLGEMIAAVEPTRSKVQSAFNQKFDQLKPLESQV